MLEGDIQYLLTDFIKKYGNSFTPEEKYNQYALLNLCPKLSNTTFQSIMTDVSLSCYGLSQRHYKEFRLLCKMMHTKKS